LPIKPEVVFEGGNVSQSMTDGAMGCHQHEDLEILSMRKNFMHRYFDTFGGTSPSSAVKMHFSSASTHSLGFWLAAGTGLVLAAALQGKQRSDDLGYPREKSGLWQNRLQG
jgi:hypothetical protein